MDTFNKFILDNGLLELPIFGSKYTWTNKQLNPIMSVLDRVLVCNLFNSHYREASCDSINRVGSDHNPLIVDTKDSRLRQQYIFRFEPLWLDQQGFKDMLKSKWPERMGRPIHDFWKEIKSATRKFCRGWSAHFQSQLKKNKKNLLDKIEIIDKDSDLRELDVTQWQSRYNLEAELEQIYSLEELQLKRQSGIKWTLKGMPTIAFFMGLPVEGGDVASSSI
jgi:plasmid maintenance system killer protein